MNKYKIIAAVTSAAVLTGILLAATGGFTKTFTPANTSLNSGKIEILFYIIVESKQPANKHE